MRNLIIAATIIVTFTPLAAAEVEIEGFRLGMPLSQAQELAKRRKYTFSEDFSDGKNPEWRTHILNAGGPTISLCKSVVSSIYKTYPSNLHEFANMLQSNIQQLGRPTTTSNSFYYQGTQISMINFEWRSPEGVKSELSVQQSAASDLRLGYGFSYIDHPCRPNQ